MFQPVNSWTVVSRKKRSRGTSRQGRTSRGFKALLERRGGTRMQGYTQSREGNYKRYAQYRRRNRPREEDHFIKRKKIRQQKRKLWQDIRNRQSQFYSSNKNTFHSLPIQGEEARGAYRTYYYEKPLDLPIEVSLHKRHVEESHLWDIEGVKAAINFLKNILSLGIKVVNILDTSKSRVLNKE